MYDILLWIVCPKGSAFHISNDGRYKVYDIRGGNRDGIDGGGVGGGSGHEHVAFSVLHATIEGGLTASSVLVPGPLGQEFAASRPRGRACGPPTAAPRRPAR